MIDGAVMLALARAAVHERLGGPPAVVPTGDWLRDPAATFVTIRHGDGSLHGCIGTLEARRPLAEELRHCAIQAAFHDPRSRPLRSDELVDARFSISVLGPRSAIEFDDEADARRKLEPHVDGVVLTWRGHRGVFLPQVWDQLPDPAAFLDQLKRKAGLATSFWADDVTLERFAVDKFAEGDA